MGIYNAPLTDIIRKLILFEAGTDFSLWEYNDMYNKVNIDKKGVLLMSCNVDCSKVSLLWFRVIGYTQFLL